jgi:hypothetical protein
VHPLVWSTMAKKNTGISGDNSPAGAVGLFVMTKVLGRVGLRQFRSGHKRGHIRLVFCSGYTVFDSAPGAARPIPGGVHTFGRTKTNGNRHDGVSIVWSTTGTGRQWPLIGFNSESDGSDFPTCTSIV